MWMVTFVALAASVTAAYVLVGRARPERRCRRRCRCVDGLAELDALASVGRRLRRGGGHP